MRFNIVESFIEEKLTGDVRARAIEISKQFPDKVITVWGNRYPCQTYAKIRMQLKDGIVVKDFPDYEHYVANDDSWQYEMISQFWTNMEAE